MVKSLKIYCYGTNMKDELAVYLDSSGYPVCVNGCNQFSCIYCEQCSDYFLKLFRDDPDMLSQTLLESPHWKT